MFSWDAAKASSNLAKHGVSFEEAATIFADFDALDWEDMAHSHGAPLEAARHISKWLNTLGRLHA